jgi:hypothetical protein
VKDGKDVVVTYFNMCYVSIEAYFRSAGNYNFWRSLSYPNFGARASWCHECFTRWMLYVQYFLTRATLQLKFLATL